MSRYLVLSFRFLAPWFHGRGDEGAPEWPPSPLRAFQALVAAAARAGSLEPSRGALTWLEKLPPPLIIAPEATRSTRGYRLSVPNNAMDLVGRQWARGDEGKPAEHRTMKNVRPSRLPDDALVRYAWALKDEDNSLVGALITAARNVVALGWGLDLVVGDGAIDDGARLAILHESLRTWEPRDDGGLGLRTPIEGTLDALARRHEAFLSRTSFADPTLRPPPALSIFESTRYARTDERPAAAIATFSLMRLHEDRFRAFDAVSRGMVVAGMLRHALRVAAESAGWPEERVGEAIMGHGDSGEPRLLLVPVPSIEYRPEGQVVGPVRRLLVYSADHRSREVSWAARSLGGAELVDERTGQAMAVLAAAHPSDRAFSHYLRESTTWTTVTPVVLPGHDDPRGLRERLRKTRDSEEQLRLLERLARRREALVRKALRHAGLGDEFAFSAQIETSDSGFIAGVDRASRYAVPQHLAKSPRMHVRLTWPSLVRGPLCIGSGRFSGMGLLVAAND